MWRGRQRGNFRGIENANREFLTLMVGTSFLKIIHLCFTFMFYVHIYFCKYHSQKDTYIDM